MSPSSHDRLRRCRRLFGKCRFSAERVRIQQVRGYCSTGVTVTSQPPSQCQSSPAIAVPALSRPLLPGPRSSVRPYFFLASFCLIFVLSFFTYDGTAWPRTALPRLAPRIGRTPADHGQRRDRGAGASAGKCGLLQETNRRSCHFLALLGFARSGSSSRMGAL